MTGTRSMSLLQFQNKFHSEQVCREHLFQLRWGKSFSCPSCQATEYYSIERRRLYECRSCGHQASLTAGTMMHKIRNAMSQRGAGYPLADIVEMDDAYFGAPRPGTDGRGTTKTAVAVALAVNPAGGPQYVRMHGMDRVTLAEIHRVATACVSEGAPIVSDGHVSYKRLEE